MMQPPFDCDMSKCSMSKCSISTYTTGCLNCKMSQKKKAGPHACKSFVFCVCVCVCVCEAILVRACVWVCVCVFVTCQCHVMIECSHVHAYRHVYEYQAGQKLHRHRNSAHSKIHVCGLIVTAHVCAYHYIRMYAVLLVLFVNVRG